MENFISKLAKRVNGISELETSYLKWTWENSLESAIKIYAEDEKEDFMQVRKRN